jgi:hypothetical protein
MTAGGAVELGLCGPLGGAGFIDIEPEVEPPHAPSAAIAEVKLRPKPIWRNRLSCVMTSPWQS